jgi:superfamily II DNA/RNA helicase
VWELIGDSFSRLESLRLLIGKEPNIFIEREAGLDLVKYYQQAVKNEVEEKTLNEDNTKSIESLIAFLQRDEIQVRLFAKPFLHAKAYLFDHHSIVGSSNFTVNGLRHNSELNLVNKVEAIAKDMRSTWFERFWREGEDYKADLLEVLSRSKFGDYPYTPFDLFIKVLFENYRDTLVSSTDSEGGEAFVVELASFQEEGFRVAKRLLETHGSVMIADAVGLGKTYQGLKILEEFVINRRRKGYVPKAVIICPAQLRDLVWRPRLKEFGIAADVLSMEEMGREGFNWKLYTNYDVILVDESHNFRKPGTGRYNNLRRIIAAGNQDKKIALLTATPINNTIFDLYHQINLMARGRDSFYATKGVKSILGFFTSLARGGSEFYDLVEHAIVRRSRRDVKRRQEQGEKVIINGQVIRFPTRTLRRIEYNLFDQLGGFYEGFVERIEGLRLVAYNLERYKRGNIDEDEINRRNALAGIFKTNFLKRLESSLKAFVTSINNQTEFQERFYELFTRGKLLDAGTQRKLKQVLSVLDTDDGDGRRMLERYDQLIGKLPEVKRLDYNVAKMEADLQHDIESLKWLRDKANELLRQVGENGQTDSKLEALKDVLRDDELRGKKVIIFSYYHDTASYLFEGLTRDTTWLQEVDNPTIDMISGRTSSDRRSIVVQRFSPHANRNELDEDTFQERLDDQIQILISTDVLSEGQNLQDAGYLINADLHWNPVRMIQRAGRIDRLGSPFEKLYVYNVFPEQGLEEILGLVERLEQRIRDIDSTVGLDASVLGETISQRSFEELRRIRATDDSVIDELEQENELSDLEDMRLPLITALQALGQDYVSDLPMGIHSSKHQAKDEVRGVFIALRAREQMYWRFYPLNKEGEIDKEGDKVTSKRRIFQMIQADRDKTTRTDNPKDITIYPFIEQAIKEIVRETKRETKKQQIFKPKLKGIAKKLNEILNDFYAAQELGDERQRRLLTVIEEADLETFKNDDEFKALMDAYEQDKNVVSLAEGLEGFFVENDLFVETESDEVTVETLEKNELELVGYEWLV